MRFAYIDSQGKEVSIPSSDALRLRIELGAIVDSTEFYDSSTDKWGPAADHEIYRTLKRELEGGDEGGFVAPPPPSFDIPTPEPAAEAPEPEPEPETEPESAPEPEVAEEPIADLSALAPDEPEEAEEEVMEFGDLAPTEEPAAELTLEEAEAALAADEAAAGGGDDFSFGDLTLADEPTVADEAESVPAAGAEESAEETFDLGGFGELTLEEGEPSDAVVEEPAAPEMPAVPEEEEAATSWDIAAEFEAAGGGLVEEEPEPEPMMGGDLVLDDATPDFSSAHGETDLLADEPSTASWLADDSPQSIPEEDAATMFEEGPPSVSEDPPSPEPRQDGGPVGDDGLPVRDEPAPSRPRPKPRNAPTPRKLTPAKSGGAGKVIGLVAALAILGGGGWFGFQALSGGGGDPAEEAIELPEIPAGLEPQLRLLATRATAAMVEQMTGFPERTAIPDDPPRDWLLGIYLANASDYENVVDYWNAYADLLRQVRAQEADLFSAAFAVALEGENMSATNETLLTERATAGFEAALRDRQLVYDQLQDVIDTSLQLHSFLVENEANIDYEPSSSGLSRDPVLEAVPVTETLQQEMWDQVADITRTLDDLGFLIGVDGRVNTEGVLNVFFEKLEATAIR